MSLLPSAVTTLSFLLVAATAAPAQSILDRARKALDGATSTAESVSELRCDIQGVCGTIRISADFAPRRYSSLAVAVTDGSRRLSPGDLNVARDIFEGELITHGYMIAPNADVSKVRDLFAKGDASWSDRELKELAEFVTGIDAVLVLDIRQADRGQCRIGKRSGAEAAVELSARWLNTPAGDVPWIGLHEADACATRESTALHDAIEKVSRQLAAQLPERRRK